MGSKKEISRVSYRARVWLRFRVPPPSRGSETFCNRRAREETFCNRTVERSNLWDARPNIPAKCPASRLIIGKTHVTYIKRTTPKSAVRTEQSLGRASDHSGKMSRGSFYHRTNISDLYQTDDAHVQRSNLEIKLIKFIN